MTGGCGPPGWRAGDGSVVPDCGESLWVAQALDAAATGPDVLLVIVDTLRPDHVTAERTPRLHAHARGAWHPEQVWSPSPWTQPAVAALFTGRPPWAIGPQAARSLPPQAGTWMSALAGTERWMVGTNPFVSDKRGFHQGFDRFAMADDDSGAVARALAWLAEPRERPLLLVVHLIGPHLPYAPAVPPPGDGVRVGDAFDDLDGIASYGAQDQARIAALYAADVAEVDARVGVLLDAMAPGSITAVVSDHGEELFEHGGFEHGHALWPEVVRVHAAVLVPGQRPERPAGPVRLQDVGQRLALAAGVAPDPRWTPMTDVVRLGYPSDRRTPIHTDGLVAPEGVILRGPTPFVSGDEAALRARLAAIDRLGWRGERTEQTWCDVAVTAGEALRLPAGTTWQDTAPPNTWGLASWDQGTLVVAPVRTGVWRLSGVDGDNCQRERPETPRPYDTLETEGLRALGYVD